MHQQIVLQLVFVVFSLTALAQSGFVSSGQSVKTSLGSLNYSIGQSFFNPVGRVITPGIQQAYSRPYRYEIEVVVFPNPTEGIITVKLLNHPRVSSYSFQLFDLVGQKLLENSIQNNETKISFEHLSSGVYILRIFLDRHQIKNLKILKNP